ncbi:MAG: transposase [Okeania sp. SIO3C4]|nr:transposase [Okeania sp. SIO3C4]
MSSPTRLHSQLMGWLSQQSRYRDKRHLIALAWMVVGLILSVKLSLPAWESHVISRAQQAASLERRWQRFLHNQRIRCKALYVPLVLAALERWRGQRLYLALDTSLLWNRYCLIHVSVICGGRAVPLLWRVIEHNSASVSVVRYLPLLRLAQRLLAQAGYEEVMLLADRGFAHQRLLSWLPQQSGWHYALRMPSDELVHTSGSSPSEIKRLWPAKGEACLYPGVRLWSEGRWRTNLVLANARGTKEPWAVITDEAPSLQTLWQYGYRFRTEELFLDAKSGAFELEQSQLRSAAALTRLYLVAAVALLFSTMHGMTVQVAGRRRQVDAHWQRGLSYLKIGLRWLKGVVNKGRQLFALRPLLSSDPEPCFASKSAAARYYNSLRFSRVDSLCCSSTT